MATSSPITTVPVKQLSTADAVADALTSALQEGKRVDEKLDGLMSRAVTASSARSACLARLAQTAAVASDDAGELASLLATATRSASAVSSRIRFLDVMKERSSQVLSRVDQILTLRICAEGAKTALSGGDLTAAADHVEQYLALDPVILSDETCLSAVVQIKQSVAELTRKVREQADMAANNMLDPQRTFSVAALASSVKLFARIGQREEGIARFCQCISAQIAREAEAEIRSLLMDGSDPALSTGGPHGAGTTDPSSEEQPHIVALTRLFECAAGFLHDAGGCFNDLFGIGVFVSLCQAVQDQVDIQGDKIFVRYSDTKGLDQIMRAVRTESANARDLDILLNELMLISQRTAAYTHFMKARCTASGSGVDDKTQDEVHSAGVAKVPAPSSSEKVATSGASGMTTGDASCQNPDAQTSVDMVLSSSKLMAWASELSANYVTLESYFMRQNVAKAIRIDEQAEPEAKTSTGVDDFFFVLQKVVSRALQYGGPADTILSMLREVNSCLSNNLLNHVRGRLRDTESALEQLFVDSNSTSSIPSAASAVSFLAEFAKVNIAQSGQGASKAANVETVSHRYDFFVAVNNAAVSADYAMRFRVNLEQTLMQYSAVSKETKSTQGALLAIGESARLLTVACEHGLGQLLSVLTSRVAGSIEHIAGQASYVVSDSSYGDDAEMSSTSQVFLNEVETKILHPRVEERLTEGNWDTLVRLVSEWIAERFEWMFLPPTSSSGAGSESGKRVNALGGLRADRDVRSLSAYFVDKCRRSSVRDVFARLSQMAMLLNLEKPTEVYDIWGNNAGGMTWRLSPTEVRRTLSLRSDFDAGDVRQLRL